MLRDEPHFDGKRNSAVADAVGDVGRAEDERRFRSFLNSIMFLSILLWRLVFSDFRHPLDFVMLPLLRALAKAPALTVLDPGRRLSPFCRGKTQLSYSTLLRNVSIRLAPTPLLNQFGRKFAKLKARIPPQKPT